MFLRIFCRTQMLFAHCLILICLVFPLRGFSDPLPKKDTERVANAVWKVFQTDLNEVKISRLVGGFSGDSLYKVTKDDTFALIRIQSSRKSSKKKEHEYRCAKIASDLGIGPELFYVDDYYISGCLDYAGTPRIMIENPTPIPRLDELIFGFFLRIKSDSLSSTHNLTEDNNMIGAKSFTWHRQLKQ